MRYHRISDNPCDLDDSPPPVPPCSGTATMTAA